MAVIRFVGTFGDTRELASLIRAEGAEPGPFPEFTEYRSIGADAETVAVILTASGAYDLIKAAVNKFRERHPEQEVEVVDDDGIDPRGYR